MAKRYIEIPSPIVLKNPATDEVITTGANGEPMVPVTFTDFIKKVLFADPRWYNNFEGLSAREAVVSALAENDKVISLAEEDWKLLEGSVKQPQRFVAGSTQREPGFGGAWNPLLTPQFMPFMKAIVTASTTPIVLGA